MNNDNDFEPFSIPFKRWANVYETVAKYIFEAFGNELYNYIKDKAIEVSPVDYKDLMKDIPEYRQGIDGEEFDNGDCYAPLMISYENAAEECAKDLIWSDEFADLVHAIARYHFTNLALEPFKT